MDYWVDNISDDDMDYWIDLDYDFNYSAFLLRASVAVDDAEREENLNAAKAILKDYAQLRGQEKADELRDSYKHYPEKLSDWGIF